MPPPGQGSSLKVASGSRLVNVCHAFAAQLGEAGASIPPQSASRVPSPHMRSTPRRERVACPSSWPLLADWPGDERWAVFCRETLPSCFGGADCSGTSLAAPGHARSRRSTTPGKRDLASALQLGDEAVDARWCKGACDAIRLLEPRTAQLPPADLQMVACVLRHALRRDGTGREERVALCEYVIFRRMGEIARASRQPDKVTHTCNDHGQTILTVHFKAPAGGLPESEDTFALDAHGRPASDADAAAVKGALETLLLPAALKADFSEARLFLDDQRPSNRGSSRAPRTPTPSSTLPSAPACERARCAVRPTVGTKVGATKIDKTHKKKFNFWLAPPQTLEAEFHDGFCLPRSLLRASGIGKTGCTQQCLEELTSRVTTQELGTMKTTVADLLQSTTGDMRARKAALEASPAQHFLVAMISDVEAAWQATGETLAGQGFDSSPQGAFALGDGWDAERLATAFSSFVPAQPVDAVMADEERVIGTMLGAPYPTTSPSLREAVAVLQEHVVAVSRRSLYNVVGDHRCLFHALLKCFLQLPVDHPAYAEADAVRSQTARLSGELYQKTRRGVAAAVGLKQAILTRLQTEMEKDGGALAKSTMWGPHASGAEDITWAQLLQESIAKDAAKKDFRWRQADLTNRPGIADGVWDWKTWSDVIMQGKNETAWGQDIWVKELVPMLYGVRVHVHAVFEKEKESKKQERAREQSNGAPPAPTTLSQVYKISELHERFCKHGVEEIHLGLLQDSHYFAVVAMDGGEGVGTGAAAEGGGAEGGAETGEAAPPSWLRALLSIVQAHEALNLLLKSFSEGLSAADWTALCDSAFPKLLSDYNALGLDGTGRLVYPSAYWIRPFAHELQINVVLCTCRSFSHNAHSPAFSPDCRLLSRLSPGRRLRMVPAFSRP